MPSHSQLEFHFFFGCKMIFFLHMNIQPFTRPASKIVFPALVTENTFSVEPVPFECTKLCVENITGSS